jgi:hypothetical protein
MRDGPSARGKQRSPSLTAALAAVGAATPSLHLRNELGGLPRSELDHEVMELLKRRAAAEASVVPIEALPATEKTEARKRLRRHSLQLTKKKRWAR